MILVSALLFLDGSLFAQELKEVVEGWRRRRDRTHSFSYQV